MRKIWLLKGRTGEYSYWREWVVRAYSQSKDADSALEEIQKWCKENGCEEENSTFYYSEERQKYYWDREKQGSPCPLDPHFDTDYTGTIYNIEETELIE